MPTTKPLTVVVSSTSSDSHTWNLVFLQLLIEELGHEVANLGACVPPALLAAECAARRPDLVVLSTVNGHGCQDGPAALAALRAQPATAAVPVVIGGKLGVRGRDTAAADDLLAAGFAAVFDGPAEVTRFRAFLAGLGSTAPALAGSPR
ncbi:cobalamin B12-binding domain-containing protein [Actinokineospora guangxiensis]|uniref:Cobalamin B12-binding domain-containing protein n=1 Tax=Actinokineospora guangxiensis TaxID=1490288 RepID=A0ABW0EJU0_9PSEU